MKVYLFNPNFFNYYYGQYTLRQIAKQSLITHSVSWDPKFNFKNSLFALILRNKIYWNSNFLVCYFLVQATTYPNLYTLQYPNLSSYYKNKWLLLHLKSFYFHQNLIISGQTNSHAQGLYHLSFRHGLGHIVFYIKDKLHSILRIYF